MTCGTTNDAKIRETMARVELMPGIESISGTVGNLTFRTVNGKTVVHKKAKPLLPEKPTNQEKAKYKRATVIGQCVAMVQNGIGDLREAIAQRDMIRHRISRLYDRYVQETQSTAKLIQRIMAGYPENGSKISRQSLDNGSMKPDRKRMRE